MYNQGSSRSSSKDHAALTDQTQPKSHSHSHQHHHHQSSGIKTSTQLLSPGRNRRGPRTTRADPHSSVQAQYDGLQSMNSGNPVYSNTGTVVHPTVSGHSQAYLAEAYGSPVHSGSSRSPYESPAHSRSSSMTSVKSLLRDRSAERVSAERMAAERMAVDRMAGDRLEKEYLQYAHAHAQSLPSHTSRHVHSHSHRHQDHGFERAGAAIRDRSLDRQLDRHHRETRRTYASHLRDRSLDREYPIMGARSLERDHPLHHTPLVRSRSIDHEFLLNQASLLPTYDMRHSRDSLILDLQSQIAELNKECATYQQELDLTKDKLSSSMNSIKTFWSPELKKERALRKEEVAKYALLNEQLKISQAENQKKSSAFQHLEQEVLKKSGNSPVKYELTSVTSASPDGKTDTLKREKDRQAKEIALLRKTIEEMELRIDTQKQTLGARDESIKKLLEMLQSKGLAVKQYEEDRLESDQLRGKVVEEERKVKQMENILEQRDKELNNLREELMRCNEESKQSVYATTGNEALHAMIETRDCRISALEKEVKLLEDELLRVREDSDTKIHSTKDNSMQIESMKSQEKLLKAKMENLKADLAKKDTELYTLKTQIDTKEKQDADHQSHISVLKEQIAAKEQQILMLQADMELLRERLKEKDSAIDKKGKMAQTAVSDKKRMENEITEVRDHMEIKDRKINVLQRKIENLEGLLQEKDTQLASTKAKIATIQSDQSSVDTAVATLESTISEREKQIERLKEQHKKIDQEHQEEIDHMNKTIRDLKTRIETLQANLDNKQHEVLELRDELSVLKSDKVRRESQVSQLDITMSQKNAEMQELHNQIKELQEQLMNTRRQASSASEERERMYEQEMIVQRDKAVKTQQELDRLLDILKQSENEKTEMDNQIKELIERNKDLQGKLNTLKRNQQTEKTKNAQLLEEARKREDEVSGDASQLKDNIRAKDGRIEELEEALRESVKITAQREMVMQEQQTKIDQYDKQIKIQHEELQNLKMEVSESMSMLQSMNQQLEERDQQLKRYESERKKHLAEAYEMKQEAILSGISEKDAHLALLETMGVVNKHTQDEKDRLVVEKTKLQAQLKDLTQSRMKLLHNDTDHNKHNDGSTAKNLSKAPNDQQHGGPQAFKM